jgi:hypothetical protein
MKEYYGIGEGLQPKHVEDIKCYNIVKNYNRR